MTTSKAFIFLLVCSLIFVTSTSPALARLTDEGKAEVSHLLMYVENSGCEFYRNGTWHTDAKAVRAHAERKLNYFSDRDRINSAEDFIRWAGSRSEISGKAYMVRCDEGPSTLASDWLMKELLRFRHSKR